jgi:hypothetical protein
VKRCRFHAFELTTLRRRVAFAERRGSSGIVMSLNSLPSRIVMVSMLSLYHKIERFWISAENLTSSLAKHKASERAPEGALGGT